MDEFFQQSFYDNSNFFDNFFVRNPFNEDFYEVFATFFFDKFFTMNFFEKFFVANFFNKFLRRIFSNDFLWWIFSMNFLCRSFVTKFLLMKFFENFLTIFEGYFAIASFRIKVPTILFQIIDCEYTKQCAGRGGRERGAYMKKKERTGASPAGLVRPPNDRIGRCIFQNT